jgi:hypothetical protein
VDSRRESYTWHEDSVCLGKANNLILLHATKLSKLKKGCEPPTNLTLKGKKKTMRNLLPPASLALIRFMCSVLPFLGLSYSCFSTKVMGASIQTTRGQKD